LVASLYDLIRSGPDIILDELWDSRKVLEVEQI